MKIGQIVFSKQGRDKDNFFIIYAIENEYLFLVDGKSRKLENPKKKKIKHVAKTNYIDEKIADMIINKSYLLDADIKKALKQYRSE